MITNRTSRDYAEALRGGALDRRVGAQRDLSMSQSLRAYAAWLSGFARVELSDTRTIGARGWPNTFVEGVAYVSSDPLPGCPIAYSQAIGRISIFGHQASSIVIAVGRANPGKTW